MNIDKEDLLNEIDLEKIEQEALIEAANLIAKNPHIDLYSEKEMIVKDKIKALKEQRKREINEKRILEDKYQRALEEIQKEMQEELKKWELEDKLKNEERRKIINSIIGKAENPRMLQMMEKERAIKEEKQKRERKSHFVSLVAQMNIEKSDKEDVRRVYTVLPEDFEKLSKRRKEMLGKLENKLETPIERKKRKNLEKLDKLCIIETIKTEEKRKNEDVKSKEIVQINRKNKENQEKQAKAVKKYEDAFYYPESKNNRSKTNNVIKASDVKRQSFATTLKYSIDHQKAIEEAERKRKDKQKKEKDIFYTGKII